MTLVVMVTVTIMVIVIVIFKQRRGVNTAPVLKSDVYTQTHILFCSFDPCGFPSVDPLTQLRI